MSGNAFEKSVEITEFVRLDALVATVRMKAAEPPGARVTFTAHGVELHGKVAGIKKTPEGLFELTLRLASLTKTDRQSLTSSE